MPYALLSCSFVTLWYCYCFLNEINGDGDGDILLYRSPILIKTDLFLTSKSTAKFSQMVSIWHMATTRLQLIWSTATGSQLSLPHGINRKLKCETKNKMMSVISPVRSRYHEAVQ